MSLLTIAIPTYNRADKLGLLLQSIADSGIPCCSEITVMCLNNASQDHTLNVLSNFQRTYPGNFCYHTNDRNIGGVRNVARCYEMSGSPYTWVIGDDDSIELPKADELLHLLSSQLPAGILLNAGTLRDKSQSWFSQGFPDTSELAKQEFLQRTFRKEPGHLMWISSQILRTQTAFEAYKRLRGGAWNLAAPLYMFMTCAQNDSFMYFDEFVAFNNNLEPTRWSKYARVLCWLDMPLVYQQMVDDSVMPVLAQANLESFWNTIRPISFVSMLVRTPSWRTFSRLCSMLLWQLRYQRKHTRSFSS